MKIETIYDLLFNHPFFKNMNPSYIETIAHCGKNQIFQENQWIAKEGEPANNFYLIRKGSAAIETHIPGQGGKTLQTLSSGEILGWSWLFPPYLWNFDVRALTEIHTVALDGKCLRNKCENNHDLGFELMKRFAAIMVRRLKATRMQIMDIYGNP